MSKRLTLALALVAAPLFSRSLPAQIQPGKIKVVQELVPRADRVLNDTMGVALPVAGGVKDVFRALLAVYKDLKIELPVVDSSKFIVGNGKLIARGDLGGKRMSMFLDCGGGLTGLYADDKRVDLSVLSWVRPAEDGSSVVHTIMMGTAINVGEGASPTQGCGSTGEFEKRIQAQVVKKLRGS